MAIDFRCEKCGKLLSVEAEPGSVIKCSECGKKVTVPAGLASLPRPNVPPNAAPQAAPSGPPGEGEEEMLEEESPAVLGVMAHIMPWVISGFFHLGLFVIMLFFVMVSGANKIPKEKNIPDVLTLKSPGAKLSSQQNPAQVQSQTPKRARDYARQQSSSASKTTRQADVIGISGASGGAAGTFDRSEGGSGATSNFFGGSVQADHIVFVIDRSGSMVDSFDQLRQEMRRSISMLSPEQDFHVIMFAEGEPIESTSKQLVPATEDSKLRVGPWLDEVRPEGQTDPIPALRRAFDVLARANSNKGKLIYLLTDGVFPDNEKVVKYIESRNKGQEVQINTYLYGGYEEEAVRVLQLIAKENRGEFKRIDLKE